MSADPVPGNPVTGLERPTQCTGRDVVCGQCPAAPEALSKEFRTEWRRTHAVVTLGECVCATRRHFVKILEAHACSDSTVPSLRQTPPKPGSGNGAIATAQPRKAGSVDRHPAFGDELQDVRPDAH